MTTETLRSRPGGNRTRRTWNDNGVNHTIETSTYSRPGVNMTFETHTTTSTLGGGRQAGTQRSQGSGGLLGTAFNLLGGMLAGQQTARLKRARQGRQAYVEDMAYGDFEEKSDEEEEEEVRSTSTRAPHTRAAPWNGRASSARRESARPGNNGRSRAYHDNRRRASYASGRSLYSDETAEDNTTDEEGISDEDDFTSEDELPSPPKPRRAFTTNDASTIKALEHIAAHHRRELEDCRRKFNTASRRRGTPTAVLQGLLDELKAREKSCESAEENLRIARGGAPNNRRPAASRSNFSTENRSARGGRTTFARSIHDDPFFSNFFQPGQHNGTGYATETFHDPFEAFMPGSQFTNINNMFANMGFGAPPRNFTAMPSATFTFNRRSNARPRTFTSTGPQFPRPMPGFGTAFVPPQPQAQPAPPPPPTPPRNLLRPAEAKRLYETYNETWRALTPSDPSIPYPARGHRAPALCARDSIWAPTVDSGISTWSDEVVMQANAQAFFLGVVGLTPTYTESPATGKLSMGYDKSKATPEQKDELVRMLKKEKMRWHSDRLGRRTGGLPSTGLNEALQTDERARAVFHAVCELMNFANEA